MFLLRQKCTKYVENSIKNKQGKMHKTVYLGQRTGKRIFFISSTKLFFKVSKNCYISYTSFSNNKHV